MFGISQLKAEHIQANSVSIVYLRYPNFLLYHVMLGRLLRLLATQYIFKEVSPDVFANNRISSVLDTYKSAAELQAKCVDNDIKIVCTLIHKCSPSEKHAGTPGMAALTTHLCVSSLVLRECVLHFDADVFSTDVSFKAAAFTAEALTRREYALSEDPNKAALNSAFQTDRDVWSWFELPENLGRHRTFQIALEGGKNMFNPRAILEGVLDFVSTFFY
jgi:hypothetical protein